MLFSQEILQVKQHFKDQFDHFFALVTDKTSTSTVAPIARTVYWSFDGNANDMYGTYNGVLLNGATYSNTTYFGTGSCLQLNASINQSMTVSSPYLNLSYTGFTVEAWIYGNTVNGDNVIFSQCQCNSCQDQCLYLLIRNAKMYMSFTLDDVAGFTSLSANTWYHVAYVYDYSTQTQLLYLQGVLENSASSSGPYQGQNASMTIGSSYLSGSSFNGYIDSLKITTRAKSADEILTDASTVVYFSFDGPTLSEDMGPNKMNGTISNAVAVSGNVGQALAFNGTNTSYLQIPGFYQIGRSNQPVTFSLWIYPYSVVGGVLIQRQPPIIANSTCYGLMGLNYMGQIAMAVYGPGGPIIMGPIISARTWTHLGYTYSSTNGLRMYVNGAFIGTSGAGSWYSSNQIEYLFVGSYSMSYCGQGGNAIYPVSYLGVIDEFYVFRRELSASDILALANP